MRSPARLLLLGLALAAPGVGRAATVTLDMATRGVGDESGVDLPQSSLIRIGTFLISDALIAANYNNLFFLSSNFVEFGSAAIGDGYGVDAHANAAVIANSSTLSGAGGTIESDRIYLWIFNAPTMGLASQQGVFYSTNANWVFPLQSAIPNTTIIDISEVPTSGVGLVIGGYGLGTSDASGEPLYNLAAIPEPGSALVLLGLPAGWLRARRRRRP